MKEKELRLALVCYGGISLAVYMHGVVKDILKLARASRAFHGVSDLAARQGQNYSDLISAEDETVRESDTEAVYFDILKDIGRHVDLRVIVDVIAGASAGGINGIFLARALAHDLPMNSLRDMWLAKADVTELLAPESKARAWSKWFLHPLLWVVFRVSLKRLAPDREMRGKLSMFLRSRWFRPPFSGESLSGFLHSALDTMGDSRDGKASLLPAGQKLDLFITLTDFFGFTRRIPIHDPEVVVEREHRHTLRFGYRRRTNGDVASDFDHSGLPGLTFAARATSSYPGAFSPAQLSEIDRVLEAHGVKWENRKSFVAHQLGHYALNGSDAEKTSFVDGSVLNNKPFYEAIQAIRERPAYRQVDRRLVYIDPNPTQPPPPPDGRIPGFLRTLKDTLSDIPRNEPVYDDLALVDSLNRKSRRMRTVVEVARPRVIELVGSVMGRSKGAGASAVRIGQWREKANEAAAREAGFAYEGYLRLKLTLVIESACRLINDISSFGEGSEQAVGVVESVDRWARTAGVYPEVFAKPRRQLWRRNAETPAWVEFLQAFDADFRRRRLRFVIRALNLLYPRLGEEQFAGVTAERLDALKERFYSVFETLLEAECRKRVRQPSQDLLKALLTSPAGDITEERVDELVDCLAQDLDLRGCDAVLENIFAEMAADESLGRVRDELIIHYIGFAFWDVLTFSIANRRDMGEFDEILVDRISPEDCSTIREGGAAAMLKGIGFNHFAAFFSRRHRENDYLWGRLNAAERLIDLLIDTARSEGATAELDARALKKRAFLAILNTEEKHLKHSPALFAVLREEIDNI